MENTSVAPASSPEPPQAVLKTDEGATNGQTKCPKCGSTDIELDKKTGMLRCNFCRHEFTADATNSPDTDIDKLEGDVVGSGAADIVPDAADILTFKCASCGAEVVVDTAEAPQARCHWCRNMLSVNQTIPNGAVPDMVLPFKLDKQVARTNIEKFVKKRAFFAHPKFKREFSTENVLGVYLPYMVIDINGHMTLSGQGEHLVKKYQKGFGDNKKTYYDADLFNVTRDFDILIDDLTVEASEDKLNQNTAVNTNNVINAILPFDTESCVKWDANFLKGFTSEKRDTNVEHLKPIAQQQAQDIGRTKANETLEQYDRGVRWDTDTISTKGSRWKSAYLPVWLYSYLESRGDVKSLHYVAVNARTGETMGSVPINRKRLIFVSLLVEAVGIMVGTLLLALYLAFTFGMTIVVLIGAMGIGLPVALLVLNLMGGRK